MSKFTSSKVNFSRFETEKRYCATCTHHSTFHQLITRDKWHMFDTKDNPIHNHQIPWFCEFIVQNPVTKEEHICACTNLKPASAEEVQVRG
jgi:hypothetical protein